LIPSANTGNLNARGPLFMAKGAAIRNSPTANEKHPHDPGQRIAYSACSIRYPSACLVLAKLADKKSQSRIVDMDGEDVCTKRRKKHGVQDTLAIFRIPLARRICLLHLVSGGMETRHISFLPSSSFPFSSFPPPPLPPPLSLSLSLSLCYLLAMTRFFMNMRIYLFKHIWPYCAIL